MKKKKNFLTIENDSSPNTIKYDKQTTNKYSRADFRRNDLGSNDTSYLKLVSYL